MSRVDGIKKTTPIVDLTFGDCPGCSRPGRTINNCGLQGFNVVISIMSLSAKESFGPMKASSGGYSGPKCSRHGSSSIDMDPAFAEAICTNCGIVLEASNIVANIQFEENTHGGSSAIRQFVHSDSKGSETGAGVVGGAEEGGGAEAAALGPLQALDGSQGRSPTSRPGRASGHWETCCTCASTGLTSPSTSSRWPLRTT